VLGGVALRVDDDEHQKPDQAAHQQKAVHGAEAAVEGEEVKH
jgi:hypothetical protein